MPLTSTYSLSAVQSGTINAVTAGDQLLPEVLRLSDGGFMLAYNNDSPTEGYIAYQHHGADGAPKGSAILPYAQPFDPDSTLSVGKPFMTQLESGNVVVAWLEDHPATSAIRASVYGPATQAVVDLSLPLVDFVPDYFHAPDITALPSGRFVLTYSAGSHVYFRIYSPAGVDLGSQKINEADLGIEWDSQTVALQDGGFVVVWNDLGGDSDLRGRVFDVDGSPRTGDFLIDTIGDNRDASVAALKNGGFAVVYEDTGWTGGDAGNGGITLQIRDANGVNQTPGAYIRVNAAGAPKEADPDVTVLDNGFILVTWTRPYSETDHDIYARLFTEDGAGVAINGLDQFAVTTTPSMDVVATVAGLLDGRFVAAWQDSTGDPDGDSISLAIRDIVRQTTGDGADDAFVGDALRDFVSGMGGDDQLYGKGGDDVLNGDAGDDTIEGGAGADALYGGADFDIAVYLNSPSKVEVRLSTGAGTFGDAEGDTYFAIEGVMGSTFDDVIVGNDSGNQLSGYTGADTLLGRGGIDTLQGMEGDDLLDGGAGADVLNGGGNSDTASYHGSAAGVQARLTTGAGLDGDAQGDTLIAIENLLGSAFADTLVGSNLVNNRLDGGAGNDTLIGNSGNDILTGGLGKDTLLGGINNDAFVFASAADSAVGGQRDVIFDFEDAGENDSIVLTGFAGVLSFIGTAAFTAANQVRAIQSGADVLVQINTTGTSGAESEILLANTTLAQVDASDFFL